MRHPRIFGVYLAAGKSKRMGKNKLFLDFRGNPLSIYGLQAAQASHLERILIISHPDHLAHWGLIRGEKDRIEIVSCKYSVQGQAESLKCGVRWAIQEGADAILVQLADQPFVSTAWINQLIKRYRDDRDDFVLSAIPGNTVAQPPIILSSELFPRLLELKGDQGARKLLRDPLIHGSVLEADDPWLLFDVDTQEDYDLLYKRRSWDKSFYH